MKKQNLLFRRTLIGFTVLTLFFGAGWMAFGQTMLGDADGNGKVEIIDALVVARYAVGLSTSTFIAANADADVNGTINIVDALVIAQYVAGILTTLPSHVTPGPTPTPTLLPVPSHLANAFENAKWYTNPEWVANVVSSGGQALAGCNTAVWLERIADIQHSAEGMGLAEHLDTCLAQGANLIIIVLYDLPNRNCSASASSGELPCSVGVTRYKTEYVDAIVNILKDPKYYGLRIVTIVEPDSLPNLVTNVSRFQLCADVEQSGCYVQCIQYVLNQLTPLPNVYRYLDIANSAWLGWDANFGPAVELYRNTVLNTTAGAASIDGFITNVCQYIPLDEPFIPDGNTLIGGVQIKNSRFMDYNPYVDELQFANDWYKRTSATYPGMGMLIDTSRNGWGGPNRPREPSTSTDVNIFVDQSRIDRRWHRGNWCNNKFAGIGVRPTAAPLPWVDAYVWIKPPGESDGVSQAGIIDPNDPNKKFDTMCDPGGTNYYCNCGSTDARSNMPHLGRWNTAFFQQLLANAYPPVN